MAFSKQRDHDWYTKIEVAFQKDLESLLNKYMQLESYDFRAFAKLWKTIHFELIYAGKYRQYELAHFTEMVLTCTKKYVLYPKSTYVQVGALYALYGLYLKQPFNKLVKIRVLLPEMQTIRSLISDMADHNVPHPVFICNKMIDEDAFELVHSQHALGTDSRFLHSDLTLRNDTFCATQVNLMDELSKTVTAATLDICKMDEEYQQKLKKYLKDKGKRIETYPSTLTEDLSKIVGQNSSQSEPTPAVAGPSIAERREQLRTRAFATKKQQPKYILRPDIEPSNDSDNSFNESNYADDPTFKL